MIIMVFKHDMHIYVYNCNQLRKISLNHDDIQTYKHAFIYVCVRMCVYQQMMHIVRVDKSLYLTFLFHMFRFFLRLRHQMY